MTAFASNILAALTGLGAKPGAVASGAQVAGGMANAFEALLAGLVAQQPGEGTEAASAEATTAVAPQAAALAQKTRIAPTSASLLAGADENDLLTDDDTSAELAGAEALILPAAPVIDVTVAAVADEAVQAAAPVVPGVAPINLALPPERPEDATGLAVVSALPAAEDDQALPGPADAVVATKGADARGALSELPKDAKVAQEQAALAVQAKVEAAPAAEQAARPAAATVVASPELVSLAARVVEPKVTAPRTSEAASPARAVPEVAEAPVVEAVEAVVDLLQDVVADLPAETPVAPEAVALPGSAAPASRRANRAEPAVRADAAVATGKVEALAPGLKTVAKTEAAAQSDTAAPVAAEADPAAVAAEPSPELATRVEAPASAASAAQPTLQAAHAAVDHAAAVRGSPETVAKLASDIVRKLEGQSTKFDVQLDPLGLGKVDVSVEINADGRLTAALSFDSAQAAADLRGRAHELRQALEKAGFDLTDSSLSFDMNNRGGGAERQQSGERFAAWTSRTFQSVQSGLDQADALLAATTYSRSPTGGVDIRI